MFGQTIVLDINLLLCICVILWRVFISDMNVYFGRYAYFAEMVVMMSAERSIFDLFILCCNY